MKIDTDEFFVISSVPGTYWRTFEDGAVVDCWGDPQTADRFDTVEEAGEYIAEGDDCGARVKRVRVKVKVTNARKRRASRKGK